VKKVILSRKALAVFESIRKPLHDAVYDSVGKQLVEESKLQQQSLNEQLAGKIQEFTENVSKTAKELIEKEFESKIKSIVQEEIKLH